MKSPRRASFLLFAVLILSGSVLAAADPRITTSDLAEDRFQPLAESIRTSLEPGGAHARLPASARRQVLEGLERIEQVLGDDDKGSRSRDRVLRREMDRVNHALAANTKRDAGSDLICRRERVLGSNIPERVCRTRAQMEEDRNRARDAMMQGQERR